MLTLYSQQKEALELTDGMNRVAIEGYEGLYEIDTKEGGINVKDRIV